MTETREGQDFSMIFWVSKWMNFHKCWKSNSGEDRVKLTLSSSGQFCIHTQVHKQHLTFFSHFTHCHGLLACLFSPTDHELEEQLNERFIGSIYLNKYKLYVSTLFLIILS